MSHIFNTEAAAAVAYFAAHFVGERKLQLQRLVHEDFAVSFATLNRLFPLIAAKVHQHAV